jgi:hypothetical protein
MGGVLWKGQAESFLEKLHNMVEKQVVAFLDGSKEPEDWGKFRENLIGLTDVTRSHFNKLVSVRPLLAPQYNGNNAPANMVRWQGPGKGPARCLTMTVANSLLVSCSAGRPSY